MYFSFGLCFVGLCLSLSAGAGQFPILVYRGDLNQPPGVLSIDDMDRATFKVAGDWTSSRLNLSKKAVTRVRSILALASRTEPLPPSIPIQLQNGINLRVRARSLGALRVMNPSGARNGWILQELFEYEVLDYLAPISDGGEYTFYEELRRDWINIEHVALSGEPSEVYVSVYGGGPALAHVVARGQDGHIYVILDYELRSKQLRHDGVSIFKFRRNSVLESPVPIEVSPESGKGLSEAFRSLAVGYTKVGDGDTPTLLRRAYDFMLQLSLRQGGVVKCGPIMVSQLP